MLDRDKNDGNLSCKLISLEVKEPKTQAYFLDTTYFLLSHF